MTTVLLVGGTGFIGRRVASALLRQGVTPHIFDLPAALERASLPVGAVGVPGDVTDPESVLRAARGVGGIVHLAGIMTVDCAANPLRAIRINVEGSINVFEAARREGIPVAYLSSAGVFGRDDTIQPHPMTLYGVTKLAVEGIARVYEADHAVPSLGLRPYVVYGPGISSGIAAGPSIAIAASARREPAEIRFSGRAGFVYVDDVAALLAAAVIRPISGATVLTVAGDTRDMDEFVARLRESTGWNGISVAGAPLRIPADLTSDPLPEWLGEQPVTTIETGIASALAELSSAGTH